MQYYNFINFIHIVDLSLLNYIDYMELFQGQCTYVQDKLVINLSSKTKKALIAFILNNINDAVQYGKTNIIVNTCKPMVNWRRQQRNKAVRSYKYLIQDQSIYIDSVKLNQFLDTVFQKLPKYNIKSFYRDDELANIVNIDKLRLVGNVNFLELEQLDIYDGYPLIYKMLSNVGYLTFDTSSYNIIKDGNCVYVHNSSYPDELMEQLRLQFLQKGLI